MKLLSLCAIALACISTGLLAQTFTTIDYPGAAATVPFSITSHGDVLGAWRDGGGNFHGFYLAAGTNFVAFDCQGAVMTRPRTMNSKGEAVGQYLDASGVWHGFYLDMRSPSSWEEAGARCTPVDPNGSVGSDNNTGAFGISDAGEIAGQFENPKGRLHAFLRWGEVFLTFDLVDGPTNGAWTMTPQGDVLGHLQAAGDRMKGWLLNRQGLRVFEFPPAELNTMSCPFGANSKGAIVGHYQRAKEQVRGFLYTGGEFISIEVPDSTGTNAYGINDSGLIVGTYYDKNSITHGFLMRP